MRAFGRHSMSSFLAGLLAVVFYTLTMFTALAIVLIVLSPWIDLGGNGRLGIPVALRIDEQALHVRAPSLSIGTPRLTKVTGTLQFEAPSRRTLIAPMLTVTAMLIIALWVVSQLRALFRTMSQSHPFAPGNALRVQRVGWAVILAEPVRAVMTYAANTFAEANFVGDGVRFVSDINLNLGPIFAGLVILVIAEVFRAGTRLDEDQSLTI